MISVATARARILDPFVPLPAETVSLAEALGRVLAAPVLARITQPPWPVATMDGYALSTAGLDADPPARLTRIGEAAAGHRFTGRVGPGEAVRIFTGAPLPEGADAVVMQEDADADAETTGATVAIRVVPRPGQFIRPAGADFAHGQVGLEAGRRLTARDIAVAAAMNVPWLRVHRRPRVAILATGDEVVMPGEPLGADQILSSNSLALGALVTALGGVPLNLGIAGDTPEALGHAIAGAAGCDLLVTTGGVSEGEHDLVKAVLIAQGGELDFWKIAMRPGKPLMFGRIKGVPLLGLPGNPVSSSVCALVFLEPVLRRFQGLPTDEPAPQPARLTAPLAANDQRQEYMRGRLGRDPDGFWTVTPFRRQDSGLTAVLARADALIVRPPQAPAAAAGSVVPVLPLGGGCLSV